MARYRVEFEVQIVTTETVVKYVDTDSQETAITEAEAKANDDYYYCDGDIVLDLLCVTEAADEEE